MSHFPHHYHPHHVLWVCFSLPPSYDLSLSHTSVNHTYRRRSCEELLLQWEFFFFTRSRISSLSAWRKCISILRTCGVPACHSNEGSLACWRNRLCAHALLPATWLFLCGFTLSGQVHSRPLQSIWILTEAKRCMERHTDLCFYNLIQSTPAKLWVFHSAAERIMPFPTCNNVCTWISKWVAQNLWMFSRFIIQVRNPEINKSVCDIWELKNASGLSLENICIVWHLRAREVVRFTDRCLCFAGWAAVKVACFVTKAWLRCQQIVFCL